MGQFKHIPLYAGFVTLILAILVSSVQIGTKGQLTNQQLQASTAQVSMSMQFSPPQTVSVLVTSNREIGAVDSAIAFDKDKIIILPGSLTSGEGFETGAGWIDQDGSVFHFSALPKAAGVSAGVVAQFSIAAVDPGLSVSTTLSLVSDFQQSSILDAKTQNYISVSPSWVTFTIGQQ